MSVSQIRARIWISGTAHSAVLRRPLICFCDNTQSLVLHLCIRVMMVASRNRAVAPLRRLFLHLLLLVHPTTAASLSDSNKDRWDKELQASGPAQCGSQLSCVTCDGVFYHGGDIVMATKAAAEAYPFLAEGTLGRVVGAEDRAFPPIMVEWNGLRAGHDGNGFGSCLKPTVGCLSCRFFVDCVHIAFARTVMETEGLLEGNSSNFQDSRRRLTHSPNVATAANQHITCVAGGALSVGDVVKATQNNTYNPHIVEGMLGTISGADGSLRDTPILVDWPIRSGHSGKGYGSCPPPPPGCADCRWWMSLGGIKKASSSS